MSNVIVVKGGRCVRILVVSALLIALAAFFVGCSKENRRPKTVPSTPIVIDFQALFTKSVQAIMETRYTDAVRLFDAAENHAVNLPPRAKAAYLIQRAQAEAMLFRGHEANKHLTEADSITRRYGLDSLRCLMYNAYGIMAQNTESDRYAALEYYIQGINLARAVGYDYMRAILSTNAAWLFLLDRDMSGLVYAEWCYNYALENKIDNAIYCGALTTAQFYTLQNRLDESEELLNVAKEAAERCAVADLTELYMAYGDCYAAMGEDELAHENFNKAISYSHVAMVDYTFFAYVHYADYLLTSSRYTDAITNMSRGLEYVMHHHLQVERPRAYNIMASAYDKLGRSDSASYYRNRSSLESESLHRRDLSNVKKNLITKYEHEHRLEIAEMELKTMRERLWLYITIFVLMFVALFVSIISRNRKVRLYKQLVAREVEWNKEKSRLEQREVVSSANEEIAEGKVSDNDKLLFDKIDKKMRVEKLYKDPYLGRDKLAELLQTNRTYISKAINSVRGESVSKYIAMYRLEAASKALSDVDDNTPIKDIAAELGFTSLSTFYSLFKERYEMSPDKFRKYAREHEE
ncbi:MAG: helix-turn-helix transcriptional regulator [Bacteroidales bacterium]|nr:helix-turn-helix transcriptional regulator [Bacteroidales bacterium]